MALFQVEPCGKCGADVWRVVWFDAVRALLTCEFCGRELRIDGGNREQGGREA